MVIRLVLCLALAVLAFGCDGPRATVQAAQPLTGSCGGDVPGALISVVGPAEQPADLRVCRTHHQRRPGDTDAAPWFQIVADDDTSTVEIISSSIYGVLPDGRQQLIMNAGVEWSAIYSRRPWFPPGDLHTAVTASAFYHAPSARRGVLHGGAGHLPLGEYVAIVYRMTVRTTGTARVQIGVDYRPDANSSDINEGTLSDWFAGSCATRQTPNPLRSSTQCRARDW